MTEDLYQTDLLRLAAQATGAGRLPRPSVTVTADNPLCGDRITLDLALDGQRVTELGHEVRACVLCQASATLLGRLAVGRDAQALRDMAQRVADLLKKPDQTTLPDGLEDLAQLKPAASIRSRHACVTLPFRALTQALDEAAAQ